MSQPNETSMGSGAKAHGLREDIKLHQLFTYSFGFLVGFGWIILTGQWIITAGSVGAALAFLFGGLLLIPVGLCYVEMATAFPSAGGEFVYAYHAFGKGVAFVTGWILLFLFVSLTAFETVATAWLMTVLVPQWAGPPLYEVQGFQVTSGMLVIMLLGAITVTLVNYRGSRVMANTQDVVTYVLLLTTLIIIATGLLWGETSNLEPMFHGDRPGPVLLAMFSVFITTPVWYSGINALPQALSELNSRPDPRTLFRLVTLMLIGSSLFYLLIILAVGMASSRDTLVGVDFATAFAIEQVLQSPLAGKLVLVSGLLAIVTTWNAAHFAASRVLFALSRSCLAAAPFSDIHPRLGSPHKAVVFVGIAGLAGASGGIAMIGAIVSSGVIVVSLLFLLTCSALFYLRKNTPSASHGYRMPGYPWLPLFGLMYSACTVVFSFYVTWSTRIPGRIPTEWLVLIVWSGMGLIMWFSSRARRDSISEDRRTLLIRGQHVE